MFFRPRVNQTDSSDSSMLFSKLSNRVYATGRSTWQRCGARTATSASAASISSPAKYDPSPSTFVAPSDSARKRDVVIVGGGHNALVSAAYLARAGLDVLLLERRHVLGGAAVTEELYPGFKYSRASYLAGLMRPRVIEELGLERHGFKYLPRDPSSFTPTPVDGVHGGGWWALSCARGGA